MSDAEKLAYEIDVDARQAGDGWLCQCPAHNDSHASLSIADGDNGELLFNCHTGCSYKAITEALTEQGLWPRKKHEEQKYKAESDQNAKSGAENKAKSDGSDTVCTLEAYAATKKLDMGFLKSLGLTNAHDGRGVRIPYRDAKGEETAVRYRVSLTAEGDRFTWKKGVQTSLYGLWRLEAARKAGYVVLVEGESDCQTLWQHGIPAVGLPGANCWREDRDARHFDGFERIYVVIEPDDGGIAVKESLKRSRINDRVWLVNIPRPYKDPSGLYLRFQEHFTEVWKMRIRKAARFTEALDAENEAAASSAWEVCKDLAVQPNLLDLFVEHLAKQGVAVEGPAAKLIYLCVNSRVLEHPVSLAIKGISSAGKSYLVMKVLRFFPDGAYLCRTAMSERALAYGDESLQHRTLVLFEAAGMGDFATYLMRSLLSEGCINYETVVNTKNGLQPLVIFREGPTNLIVTTTATSLHPENETRLISITVADTPEQTMLIMQQSASNIEQKLEPISMGWIALQEWLSLSNEQVSIPFSNKLVELIPPVSVRLRRDVPALLNLIMSHAWLHKATRERDESGRIVATLQDYAIVRELVADLIAAGVGATVPADVRETVNAVIALSSPDNPTTIMEVAKWIKIDYTSASRRVKKASELGFVLNVEEKKNRPKLLVVGQPMPDQQVLLPEANDPRLTD